MSIKVALEHRTSYTFDRLVRVYPHRAATPRRHSRTSIKPRCTSSRHFINWQQDALGSFLAAVVPIMRQLRITVRLIADLSGVTPSTSFIEDWARYGPTQKGWPTPKALAVT